PGPAPGNGTTACLELEFRMTDAISSDGENSSVLIWNGTVMNTEARPCGDGVTWTGAVSELGTSSNPATANDGMPVRVGLCCWEGTTRMVPSATAIGWIFMISKATCKFNAV